MLLSAAEIGIVMLTMKVALWSVILSLPFGLAAAHVLARREFRGKSLFDAIVHLPLVLPPVVVGYGLLMLFGKQGPLGAWLNDWFGISVAFRWSGAAIACAVMSFPLMVRAMRLSMEAIDPKLEAAARTLGAGRLGVLLTITLPLALPGILTGMLLAFARSLGEFGATITFVSNIPDETQTLPLAIYALWQSPGGEAAAQRLCVLSLILSLAALLISEALVRRARQRIMGHDTVRRD
jgi:molybdate transport system permease protein